MLPLQAMAAVRVAAVSLAVAALVGCRGCDPPLVDTQIVGVVGNVDGVDLASYLAVARAIVAKPANAGVPAALSPAVPGHRVFVTAWVAGKEPISATGLGATLFDSIVAAATEVAKTAPPEARLELQVVTGVTKATVGPEMQERVFEIGLHGYLVNGGQAGVGWVLPIEIVSRHRITARVVNVGKGEPPSEMRILDGEPLAQGVAARAHVASDVVPSLAAYRFDVADRLETVPPDGPPLTLYRTAPKLTADVSPEALLRDVHAGADYLARVTDERGRFEDVYDPTTDTAPHSYSTLRQAEAIYALMCAYEEEPRPAWLDAAKRATSYLKSQLKTLDGAAYIKGGESDGEQEKVGGAGLALVAMAEYAAATGDKGDIEAMRALARGIIHQQYPDGHFRANADVAKERDAGNAKIKREKGYYPGEATLGLVRLYGIDPDPKWLAAARSAADYVVHVRDANKMVKDQIPDHWLSYALHDLYVATSDAAYAGQADKISREIIVTLKHNKSLPYPDYHGSFLVEADTIQSSTRLEALTSTLQLMRFKGDDLRGILPSALEIARFTTSQQYRPDSAYFAKTPSKAIGGVRESVHDDNIRIDGVQHAICGWLRLAKILRDPTYGAPPPVP
jgi:hypothetical protein